MCVMGIFQLCEKIVSTQMHHFENYYWDSTCVYVYCEYVFVETAESSLNLPLQKTISCKQLKRDIKAHSFNVANL